MLSCIVKQNGLLNQFVLFLSVSPPGGDFSDPVTSATLGIVQVNGHNQTPASFYYSFVDEMCPSILLFLFVCCLHYSVISTFRSSGVWIRSWLRGSISLL